MVVKWSGDLPGIELLVDAGHGDDFLDVMQFNDQNGQSYIVIIYDSLELSQDPEVMEFFCL